MGRIVLITGGARSGKSTFAEEIVKKDEKNVIYIATAIAFDDGMKDRIKKHKSQRPKEWNTVEMYKDFGKLRENEDFLSSDIVLLDCVTLMVSNIMLDSRLDFDNCEIGEIDNLENSILNTIKELIKIIKKQDKMIIFVTNEVGMGLVPAYKMGNYFRDIAGRVNQYLAREANEVFLMVSGIAVKIK